jgi:signal transduction histidine kinase/CheY-like chemotaxis protein
MKDEKKTKKQLVGELTELRQRIKKLEKLVAERKRSAEERNKLEAQVKQIQKIEALGTLAGGIAHDFNNLLMNIQGHSSMMLLNIDSAHPHYGRLKNIINQVQSGSKLTSQLLGYARKGKYEVKFINLNRLVEETSETFGRTRKEFTIHRELAEDLFAIEVDEGQIEQALLNLYVNAGDAMDDGGELILKTSNITHDDMKSKLYDPKPGNYVQLNITDTGAGMDQATMERIFEPFFTTKEMGKGTGLGLASVYGIIKGHDGYIDVDSKIGHGTTFTIYLPGVDLVIPKAIKAVERVVKGNETILLVDDEERSIGVSVELLESLGYTIFESRSGKEAIEVYQLNRDKIDLIILDMVMPDMSGGETYDIIKKMNPDIKVILASGYSVNGQATEILERGCNAFIQKPFGRKELSQKIRDVLRDNQ